jgi:hypothetical protein
LKNNPRPRFSQVLESNTNPKLRARGTPSNAE